MASAAGTRVLLACGVAGLCAALVVVRAGPASAQGDGSGNTNPSVTVPAEVRELWREYPLNPPAPPAAPRRSGRGQPTTDPRSSAADAESDSIPVTMAVAVGAGALALVALALLARRLVSAADFRLAEQLRPGAQPLRRHRNRRRERAMEDRPDEPLDPHAEFQSPTADDDPRSEDEPLPAAPKNDKLESDSADAAERSNAVKIARSATPEQGDQNENYAHVGEEVASVLTAAHQAADQIRATALEEAEQIREEANADAASTRDQAGRAAEQARRETEALRAEADEYTTEAHEAADRYVAATRQQIEDEAARRRAEIDREARESHRAAEQQAREIETEALKRRRAIIEEAERSEARLEQLLGVFRGMTSQLEELLRPEPVADDADAPDESVADEFTQDLRPQRSRTEPATGRSRPPT